jgi:hypothetical protein
MCNQLNNHATNILAGYKLPPSTQGRKLTIAPRLCPISCATTCHSPRARLETAVPEITSGGLPEALVLHNCPGQAAPIIVPVGQPLMRCHRPAPSDPLYPLHCENRESLSGRVILLLHAIFHGRSGLLSDGQLKITKRVTSPQCWNLCRAYMESWTLSSIIPKLTLNVSLYKELAVFQLLRI